MGRFGLDSEQRRQLREDGYLLLPGLVPPALVEQALYTINHALGSQGIDPAQLAGYRARSFTPDLMQHPALTGLYAGSPLHDVAEAALGPGRVQPPKEAQIALRFPGAGGKAVPHIDGISYPGNGVPPGTLYHFTALGGVFLSDVTGPDRGNLTVWPGSHRLVEQHLRTNGVGSIVNGFPDLPLGPPRPILARAGDALLAHYQLAHGIAPNQGPHIRYAVFFRLFHAQHEQLGTRPLTDQWLEWEGLAEA